MIVIGYACLGLLVGMLTGLTSSPIAATVLAAIFTLAGGSILPLTRNSDTERKLVGSLLTGFALLCLVGVLVGIYVKTNETLGTPGASAGGAYLKTGDLTKANAINTKYKNGDIDPKEAYRQLWELVQPSGK
jgi:hypothetical protein